MEMLGEKIASRSVDLHAHKNTYTKTFHGKDGEHVAQKSACPG